MKATKFILTNLIVTFLIIQGMGLYNCSYLEADTLPANNQAIIELKQLELSVQPLNFDVVHAKRFKNKDNIDIYYLNDNELPIISIKLIIKRGSFHDPRDKQGLANMFASVWRQSGSKNYSGKDLNDYFEFIGGSMEVSFSRQYGSVSLSILKKYLDQSLPKLKDFISNPQFKKSKLELVRGLKLESLKRTMDSPFSLAFRYFKQITFPKSNYAKKESKKSLTSINIPDLKKYYKDTFSANNLTWIITGDISQEQAKRIANSFSFSDDGLDFTNKSSKQKSHIQDNKIEEPKIYIINRKMPQSTVLLGGPGLALNHKDNLKLMVANFILGKGGFNSHLMKEIRSKRGLAYSVGSITRGYKDFGVFVSYVQTKNGSVKQVIKLIKKEMKKMRQRPISQTELKWAKDSISNKFVFMFSSTLKIVLREFELDYNQMPQNYMDKYLQNLKNISSHDIQNVSNKIFQQDKFPIIVVGPANFLKQELKTLGRITIIQPSIE